MLAVEVISEIRKRGATLKGDEEGRLRVRPASILTPELVAAIRQHKAAILESLEPVGSAAPPVLPESRTTGEAPDCSRLDCPCVDCSAPAPKYAKPIETTGEVLEMARDYFGLSPKEREGVPYPPHEGSGDPMVRKHGEKAQFFQDVRRRDRERREREGLPPWIRIVDGGRGMSYALEDARRRKRARPLYLELHAMGLELVASVDGEGEWCLELEGLNSLSPAHADRVRVRVQEHERGLLWALMASGDDALDAIRGELR